MRFSSLVVMFLLASVGLGACGTKGPLVLSPAPASTAGTLPSTPATPVPATPSDDSKAGGTTPR